MKQQRTIVWFLCILLFGFSMGLAAIHAYAHEKMDTLIGNLTILDPVIYENLSVFPMVTSQPAEGNEFFCFEESLESKVLEVKEVEGGQVPQVVFINRSASFIFIMGGEVLAGCKQDRVVGRDILIPPHEDGLLVPVFCVEAGRWSYESTSFYSKKNAGTYNLRSLAQENDGTAQAKLWDEVARMNEHMKIDTETGAYQDAYDKEENILKINECEERMKDIPQLSGNIAGVIIGVGKKIVSVDIFLHPQLFQKLWPKILKSSALMSIMAGDDGVATKKDAEEFLAAVSQKEFKERGAVGSGVELSFLDESLNVCALVFGEVIIHCAGFPPVVTHDVSYDGCCDWETNDDHAHVRQSELFFEINVVEDE
jgi:hypothetical protein